jgi:NADH:ubiquinone oxidoreductase subunit 2 (subunit N)
VTLLAAVVLWLLLLALAAHLLRRLPGLPGLVIAVGMALLLGFLWRLPSAGELMVMGRTINLARPNVFLGFTLLLDASARAPAFLLIFWGGVFGLAAGWTGADRVLFSTIPLILAAMIIALSSAPMLWAPLWLLAAAVLMAFPAQGASPRLSRPALRILLIPTLAFPFFLFAAWALAQSDLAVREHELWVAAWRGLVIGLAILLTPVPLHSWITGLGDHAPPFAAAFLVGVWQITAYALVRRILLAYPTVAEYTDPALWLPWLAVIQVLWAAVLGLGSHRLGQWWGYLLLWDYGAAFLLWSLSGEFGNEALIWLSLARPLVLVLIAGGLQAFGRRFGAGASLSDLHGGFERLPLASIGLVAGGLFLLGWPLGALFPLRMAVIRLAEASQPGAFLWVALSLLLMTVTTVRVLRALGRPLSDAALLREAPHLGWLIIPLLLVGFLLSIHPSLLDPVTVTLSNWLARSP